MCLTADDRRFHATNDETTSAFLSSRRWLIALQPSSPTADTKQSSLRTFTICPLTGSHVAGERTGRKLLAEHDENRRRDRICRVQKGSDLAVYCSG